MNVFYDDSRWIGSRFIDNLVFAVKPDLGDRGDMAPNLLEKTGNAGLWLIEKLPGLVWEKVKDPRFVSLALTILALGAVSLAFYPITTVLTIKAAVVLLPTIPLWALKFSAYLLTCATIVSYGIRAQGRFWNMPLYTAFLNNRPVLVAG